jgi:hypothetical protein
MPDGSDNIIEYDLNNPAAVFTESEIAFMEAICAKLSVAELQKVRAVEHAAFNKTTQRSSFHVLPGIRNILDQGNIYFSRFSKKLIEP